MKYSDFITLQDYFHPVFNLQNEVQDYWKQFIPTKQFYDLLGKTVDAVSSNQSQNRKSIWVKGTFGTGKSHAGSVVKHLLCNDLNEFADYIEDRILLAELKSRLLSFRKEKKLFPVVLKGTENGKIYDMRSFRLTLERIIKESLRKAGKAITVKSDYERAIEYLESTPIDINAIIANEPELRSYAKSKDDIIKKLKTSDTDVYLALEEALAQPQYSVYFTSSDLGEWLSEVEKEVVDNQIANGLLIIWDEFTSVMDTITSGMTDMMQGLAEKTEKQNIYFYLISHRNSNAYNNADITRMEGRFHILQYNMESLTTYRIMAASIRKLDEQQYLLHRSDRMDKHTRLISYLTENDNQQSARDIKDLYPFHPYSAFLCSAIANQLGSANRTVMQFMYDDNGFLGFLKDNNNGDSKLLLTADKLWDYFLDEFTDDTVKFGIVTQTYFDRIKAIEQLVFSYQKVFKGILLLNAMRLIVEHAEKIMPSTKNIKYLFEGEDFENQLDEILNYFDENQIIQRDPSGNFLIAFASLPQNEINESIKRAESNFSDIIKIIGYDKTQNENSIKSLLDDSLIRQPAFAFLSCSEDNLRLRSYIKTAFKEPYTLNIAMLFATDIAEKQKMQETLKELANTDDYKNVIFVLFDEVFENNGRQKSRFYYYVATADVSRNHNAREQQQVNDKNAKDIINQWIIGLKQGTATVYYQNIQETKNSNNLAKYINENIDNKIFSSSVDAMLSMRQRPMTFWKTQNSKNSAEVMLVSTSRDEAERKFSGQYTPAKFLFKDDNDDYIVDADLKLKDSAPANHPLVLTQKKVDEIFGKIKKDNRSTFNLGTELQTLTQPPFGLYSNIPNMAVLAFAMRKYVNELNGVDLGTPIDANNMRDKIVDVFSAWAKGISNGKLSVRFGSKEEKDLKDLLIGIFDMQRLRDIPDLTSLKNVRWGVVAYCKEKSKLPLWCLKYSSVATDDFRSMIDQLVHLVQEQNELKETVVKSVLKAIEQHKFELSRVLMNTAAFEEGFKTFVGKIDGVTIKDEWYEELKEYLNQQITGEIGYWEERTVENAILRFSIKKNEKDEVKNVSVSPNSTSIEKGKSLSFYANVEVTGNATKEIAWTIENGTASTIDNFGSLKVDANETSTNLIVKATSKFDNLKFGVASITITAEVSNTKIERARTKVLKASNIDSIKLKNVLSLILEKYPQVADIIDENIEDE
jgi:hypothetical protein